MRIATWNVNSLRVRLDQLLAWLEQTPVDLIGLQETKLIDEDFPVDELATAGYCSVYAGQRTYNGVAILARTALSDVTKSMPTLDDPQARFLAASMGELRVVNLYVPNGQTVGSEKYAYKLEWLDRLRDQLASELSRHRRVVVVGDFNIAPQDRDVHDPAAWEGAVLVSERERMALRAILDRGLEDTFRLFDQPEGEFSWWDYRAGAFRRNRGLRIDLILASAALAETCRSCHIDKTPRGWPRPSDHAPVVAEFVL